MLLKNWLKNTCEKYSHRVLCPPMFTYKNLDEFSMKKKKEYSNRKPGERVILSQSNSMEFLARLKALWELDCVPCLIPSHMLLDKFRYCKTVLETSKKDEKERIIFFTSSTSSLYPKGVKLSDHNIVSHIDMLRMHVPDKIFNYTDRTFAFLPWTHCYGLLGECFSVLDRGASMGVYPYHKLNFPSFYSRIHLYNPTILFVVPRFLEMIYHSDSRYLSNISEKYRKQLWFGKNIKYIVSGGAKLNHEIKTYFYNTLGVKILQGYGCSEMSPMISLQTEFDVNDKSAGRLLPGVQLNIDENNRIFVNGPNKFLGYLHDEKSDNNDFLSTGDLGYFRDDRLYITGRDSQFIKLSNGRFLDLSILENTYKIGYNFKEICIWQDNNNLIGFAYPSISVIRTRFQDTELFIYPADKSFLSIENGTINMKGEICRMQVREYFKNYFNI